MTSVKEDLKQEKLAKKQKANKDRRLQDRRSPMGRKARQFRKACNGAFGNMRARDWNDRVFGTPNGRPRDEGEEGAVAHAKLAELLVEGTSADPQTKTKPRRSPAKGKQKDIPDTVRFDKPVQS